MERFGWRGQLGYPGGFQPGERGSFGIKGDPLGLGGSFGIQEGSFGTRGILWDPEDGAAGREQDAVYTFVPERTEEKFNFLAFSLLGVELQL